MDVHLVLPVDHEVLFLLSSDAGVLIVLRKLGKHRGAFGGDVTVYLAVFCGRWQVQIGLGWQTWHGLRIKWLLKLILVVLNR